jgi:CheY-like chemotaxis protein
VSVAPPKPLVLYVEDDPDTFRLAALRLQARYELLGAATDREACALLSKHGDSLFAVLMDVELQGSQLDGLALVKALRGLSPRAGLPPWAQTLPKLPHLPVIVMTAFADKYSETQVKALGATHLLSKPIDFARLNLALAQANIQSVMARLASQPSKR